MHDPIFGRSFSRYEQKKIGHFAFFGCVVIALSICTVFKPQFHLQSFSATVKLQVSSNFGVEEIVSVNDSAKLQTLQSSSNATLEDRMEMVKDINISKLMQVSTSGVQEMETESATNVYEASQLSIGAGLEDTKIVKDTNFSEPMQLLTSVDSDGMKIVKNNTNIFEPLQLSTSVSPEDRKIVKYTNISEPSQLATSNGLNKIKMVNYTNPSEPLQMSTTEGLKDMRVVKDTNASISLQMSNSATSKNMTIFKDTVVSQTLEVDSKKMKPLCSFSEPISDFCDMKGDIRVHPSSSTIFIASDQVSNGTSWFIKPYARKGGEAAMQYVKKWTIKVVPSHENSPSCTQSHRTPAILFSTGGFSGNHFHDFTDTLIPLFSTSRNFNGEVHFLVTNHQRWWTAKYKRILDKLSRYMVVDIDREEGTRCYESMIIGLKTRKELGIVHAQEFNEGLSMKDFIHFLRSTYSLKRKTAIKRRKNGLEKPRLMIISRKRSRILMNESKVTKMAQSMGYEVIVDDANQSTNLSKFAELVNSCDVLMGIHGAGLTNMVFLPDNAVVIQIVPFGIDGFAKHDFGEPALDIDVRYMGYNIKVKESTLIQKYSLNHPVFRDPLSLHKQGWDVIRSIYLEQQNVMLDLRRFRGTLLKALRLLR